MASRWHALIVFIFCLILGALASSFVISLFAFENTTRLYIVSAFATQGVMFFGSSVLYFRIMAVNGLQYVSFQNLTKRSISLTALYFSLAILAVYLTQPIAELILDRFHAHPWVQYQLKTSNIQNTVIGSLRGLKMPIAIIVFAMLPAICEELVFRGILYRILKERSNYKQLAMLGSALVFAVFHFQVLSVIPIFIVGYLLALLYEKTNNLLPGIMVHFAFNAIQIIVWQA